MGLESAQPPEGESPQEEDSRLRSVKKAKPNGDKSMPDADDNVEFVRDGESMIVENPNPSQGIQSSENKRIPLDVCGPRIKDPEQGSSYKDRLMSVDTKIVLSPTEIVQLVAEDYGLEEMEDVNLEEEAPFNPKSVVEVSLEEYDQWCKPWKLSLIVKLLGKSLEFRAMETWIRRTWSWNGDLKVRIPKLPVKLYTDKFLWRAGKKIGTMLKIDQNTSIHSRGKFARLCVEIDLRRKLVLGIKVLGHDFKVEYEGLHLICFGCGRYGHRIELCSEGGTRKEIVQPLCTDGSGQSENAPKNLVVESATLVPEPSDSISPVANIAERNTGVSDLNEDMENGKNLNSFGSWMLVKRPQRKNMKKKVSGLDPNKGVNVDKGSRYQVLD
ncbi:hypothetical protein Ahy_B02g058720 [Arachis hypogaea]|uniref:CCHC-type domain-containing protein n=1 Tax=Arachis hypogaea TaxID=3818 RepID=A0A445AF90_ARAHY|nr:hypothetical protein Ahy_B02g058720 [Arachis hypogaea]